MHSPLMKIGATSKNIIFTDQDMIKPDTPLMMVEHAGNPLEIVSAMKKNIVSQSTPIADQPNCLSFDFSFNVPKNPFESQSMTISGLFGTVLANYSVPLISKLGTHSFCRHNPFSGVEERGLGTWEPVTATLIFTLCAGIELARDTTYRVSWDIMNPNVSQPSPSGISLQGSGSLGFPSQPIDKLDEELLGVRVPKP